tara:strand:- start:12747 stop:13019 length:273 start_codon:yes stop_codon:yes gene_type:complete
MKTEESQNNTTDNTIIKLKLVTFVTLIISIIIATSGATAFMIEGEVRDNKIEYVNERAKRLVDNAKENVLYTMRYEDLLFRYNELKANCE